jgi:hypothetical protein
MPNARERIAAPDVTGDYNNRRAPNLRSERKHEKGNTDIGFITWLSILQYVT